MRLQPRQIPVTAILLGIIALVYVAELFDPRELLVELGANQAAAVLGHGEYWRLLTSIFLHGGFLHVLLNGVALYQLGSLFELLLGSGSLFVTFLVSGLAGSLASVLWNQLGPHADPLRPSVGASGAIFGLLGALIAFLLRRRGRLTPAAKSLLSQLLFWAGVNVFLGISSRLIDNAAHMGGLAAGLVLGLVLREPAFRPPPLPEPLPPLPPGPPTSGPNFPV
ncbi:MAG TPA: rhomboid family intramembrane serine protease [Thermoanaerobaculia bacterium]|nr:rhomboid family intramembrane serine protease [Thermoanaerobaculia bacterium]